jgi:hypothetical protein
MIEYLGWDNYVKEQERFITGWINNDFDSLVDKVKDLEKFSGDLLEGSGRLESKIEDLEEWKQTQIQMDLRASGLLGDVMTKVASLEEWKERITIAGNKWGDRVKDLENLLWNGKHAGIERLQKQVNDLEEWKSMTPDTALVRESASQFNQRIIALELSTRYYHNLEIEAPTDKDIWDKVKDLEKWQSEAWRAITKLEEWKQGDTKRMDGHHETLMNLDEASDKQRHKIEKLEEWKQHHINLCNRGRGDVQNMVIDKKVWEDIKRHVTMIEVGLPVITAERTETHFKDLKDAIKQADPSWCLND